MSRVYLVRHGETDWNRQRRYQGNQDIPLNERGIAQAEMLRSRLDREPFDVIFASPLQRARQTADLLNTGRSLPLVVLPQLRERSGGAWEGQLYSELGAASLEDMQRREVREGLGPPGGETLAQVADRAELAWADVLRHGAERALVVAHNGFLHALIGRLLGMPLANYWQIKIDTCSLTVVEVRPDGPEFLTINETAHLEQHVFS